MNWKINWGKKYEKATYPTREKLNIPMFDIKEFVDKIKAEKFQSMVGNMNEQPSFPFGQANPFGGQGNNPFAGGNPFENNNPFPNNQNAGIDLDEVVKRIDAKIAELEAEEAAEKENNDWSYETEETPNDIDDNETSNTTDIKEINEEDKKTKDEVTDDEFFDDFWSDGE